MAISIAFIFTSCGGNTTSTNQTPSEAAANETTIVDSISIAIDKQKTELNNDTKSTIEEIDSLLNGI